MAVGEAVNKYFHTVDTFQPAANVEIMVLCVFTGALDDLVGITNGVNTANSNVYYSYPNPNSNRFIITNTDYYETDSIHANAGFSGIQIK